MMPMEIAPGIYSTKGGTTNDANGNSARYL